MPFTNDGASDNLLGGGDVVTTTIVCVKLFVLGLKLPAGSEYSAVMTALF